LTATGRFPQGDDAVTTALYPVHEVFASIQGEGAFVGEPQVFLRLAGCPLRCRWCDTPRSWRLPAPDATLADPAFGGERAWASAERIARWVEGCDPGGAQSVSLTGGEPLMWPALPARLRSLLPGRRLHLETSGAFSKSLARVLESVDHVSCDLKLPADLAPVVPLAAGPGRRFEPAPPDGASWRGERRAVLRLLAGRDACLKLVVAGGRAALDYEALLRDAAELAPELPLVVQPLTPTAGVGAPAAQLVQALARDAVERGLSVRVLPQVHILLGLR